MQRRSRSTKVALAVGLVVVAAGVAQAQVAAPARSFTRGVIVALNQLAAERSGLTFDYLPPVDPDRPALIVDVDPAIGLDQTVNVFAVPPVDPDREQVGSTTVNLHPPDPGLPAMVAVAIVPGGWPDAGPITVAFRDPASIDTPEPGRSLFTVTVLPGDSSQAPPEPESILISFSDPALANRVVVMTDGQGAPLDLCEEVITDPR